MPRGSRRLPAECVRRLEAADLILHAGDFTSAEVYSRLREYGPLEAVHGNMDDARLKRALPGKRVVEVGQVRIGLVHEPAQATGFDECDALVFGHTHMPVLRREGKQWLLNPGSPTERRRSPVHSMLVVTVKKKRLEPQLIALA
jgi:putative phosphoesterase